MRIACVVVLAIAVACRASPHLARQQNRLDFAAVDSIVLERGPCLGGACPVYRLSIASHGRVQFQSGVPQDQPTATDSIASGSFRDLVRTAKRISFATLPSFTPDNREVCGYALTDFPSVRTSVFAADRAVVVDDYRACHGPTDQPDIAQRLQALRRFEDAIDSVARAGRWVR